MRETNGFKNTSTYATISDIDSEKLTIFRERVKDAFSEAERKNDERIFTIKNRMINKTVETIMEAEKQNDQRIKNMINSIPSYTENVDESTESTQFSFDLISDLR